MGWEAIFTGLRQCFSRSPLSALALSQGPLVPALKPAQSFAPPPPLAPERRSAVDMLRDEPNLTAAELAQRAGVTLSYATTLVRRNRSRLAPAPTTAGPSPIRIASNGVDRGEGFTRAHILAAASQGTSVLLIAEQFGVAPGEVEFALKVARLAKQS